MTTGAEITRVVILGHTGFIGQHVLKKCVEMGNKLEVLGLSSATMDLTRWEEVESLASKFDSHTSVVMCSSIKRQVDESPEALRKNLEMVCNVARLLRERRVKRFLFFSSAAVYGEVLDDLYITEETPVNPVSYYGIAKYTSECLLRKVAQEMEGLSLVIFRPALVYGPGDETEHYRPADFATAIIRSGEVTLWGDGSELRDFIFVGDVAEITRRMIFSDCTGTYNVITGQTHAFREILDIFKPLCPDGLQIRCRPRTRPKVNQGYRNDKLLRAFPDFPYTSFREGITRTFLETRSSLQKRGGFPI